MRYQLLGPTGLRVSELCLGTMTFGPDWGWGASKGASRQMWDAFAEAGGNFIDTANAYTNGTSEELVGEFAGSERDRFVIATKYTSAMYPGDPNSGGNHRKALVRSVEDSLRRLGTDYIDLLWVHAWDVISPVEEVMRALDDLVLQGKVLYVGASDFPAWVVSEANTLASERGFTPFAALQIEYSLIERTPERDLLPMAEAHDLSVLDWSPLASGTLTGKYLGNGTAVGEQPESDGASSNVEDRGTRLQQVDQDMYEKYRTERARHIAQAVVDVADEVGHSPAQVALAWILAQPGRHIPIIGASTPKHIEDNLGCLDVALEDDHLDRLSDASQIDLGFPHEFLGSDGIKQFVFGGTYDALDVPARTRRIGHLPEPD